MLTHYAYISGPNGMRQLSAAMDLSAQSLESRRKLIHACLLNGELLAKAPASEIEWTRESLSDWVANRKVYKSVAEWAANRKAVNRDASQDLDDPRR